MTDSNAQTIRKRSTGGRIGLIVTSAVAGLMALAALGVGAAASRFDSEKTDQLPDDRRRAVWGRHARARSDNLEVAPA